jgi:hypothetical protein
MTLEQSPIGQIAAEVAIATGAVMLGIKEHEVHGSSGVWIAEIVKRA